MKTEEVSVYLYEAQHRHHFLCPWIGFRYNFEWCYEYLMKNHARSNGINSDESWPLLWQAGCMRVCTIKMWFWSGHRKNGILTGVDIFFRLKCVNLIFMRRGNNESCYWNLIQNFRYIFIFLYFHQILLKNEFRIWLYAMFFFFSFSMTENFITNP